jgi:hypothetical protein
VLHEFDAWAKENPEGAKGGKSGMVFFAHLQQKRPELLDVRFPGDKWQQVKAWLSAGSQRLKSPAPLIPWEVR